MAHRGEAGSGEAGSDRRLQAVDVSPPPTCEIHRWGRSRITRGITALLQCAVVSLGLYLLGGAVLHLTMGAAMDPGAPRSAAPSASFLANYFWLASICSGFIGTLRFSVYKEVTSCPVCATAGDPPFYRDPATAFHRYVTMMIVSTLSAFVAVLVGLLLP
jgi:hypothetical protein